jgi:hypothetical protein
VEVEVGEEEAHDTASAAKTSSSGKLLQMCNRIWAAIRTEAR